MKNNILITLFIASLGFTQVLGQESSGTIYKQLEKLNFLGSALYIAAHPDDENTALISYFSNHVNAHAAYQTD